MIGIDSVEHASGGARGGSVQNGPCDTGTDSVLKNYGRPGDTGYAGLEVLPDGTMVSTTYCVLEPGQQPLVVSVRFMMEDIDAAAGL